MTRAVLRPPLCGQVTEWAATPASSALACQAQMATRADLRSTAKDQNTPIDGLWCFATALPVPWL